MGGKKVGGVVFGPKPPPDPNFIKIGLGHRTLVLHLLIVGLLSWGIHESFHIAFSHDFSFSLSTTSNEVDRRWQIAYVHQNWKWESVPTEDFRVNIPGKYMCQCECLFTSKLFANASSLRNSIWHGIARIHEVYKVVIYFTLPHHVCSAISQPYSQRPSFSSTTRPRASSVKK